MGKGAPTGVYISSSSAWQGTPYTAERLKWSAGAEEKDEDEDGDGDGGVRRDTMGHPVLAQARQVHRKGSRKGKKSDCG